MGIAAQLTSLSFLIRGSMAGLLVLASTASHAAPVTVEVAAPGATASINLRNDGEHPLDAQIRVFRWTQIDGKEILVPSDDVVASPPAVTLQPKEDYVVRVVRTSKRPVSGEETYRLLIDELPEPAHRASAAVNIVLRYSIPVFFSTADDTDPKLTWTVQQSGGRSFVVATNSGDRRMRIAGLKVQLGKGETASFGDGLVGYVLGRSTMRWAIPRAIPKLKTGAAVQISALSDLGPISAQGSIQVSH